MKIETYIVHPDLFDRILSGEMTQYFVPVTPKTIDKLIQLNEKGFEVEDADGNSIPVHYDAIEFMTSQDSQCDSILVEVKDAYAEMFVNEYGEPFWFRNGDQDWAVQQVVYNLGSILEKSLYRKPGSKSKARLKNKPLRIIDLKVNQERFDDILSGAITEERRDIRPSNSRTFVETDSNGIPVWGGDFNSIPLHYDAIRFYMGRKRGGQSILVEVKEIHTELSVMENNQVICYSEKGAYWFLEEVVYTLGEILEQKLGGYLT